MNPHESPDPYPSPGWEPGDYVVWGEGPEADPGSGAGPSSASRGRKPKATTKQQGQQKTPGKVGWSDVVANRDSARSGDNSNARDNYRDIEKRVEGYRTKNKLLRQELEKSKKAKQ
ncbi:hypothetical protein MRX96_053372 [Rhipicephalus microplus]